MEDNERPLEVGEAVTPQEDGPAAPEAAPAVPERPEAQSHEENHRYQAARRRGEKAGYQRALRELETRAAEEPSRRERELEAFIERDAEEFLARFPGVDPAVLDADETFRRFCGSRYGRESLSSLYEDYRTLTDRAAQTAARRRESRLQRTTGSGGGGSADGLSAAERASLEEWNRAFPQMKMTAREYLDR